MAEHADTVAVDPDMLRRAATACRNIQAQAKAGGRPHEWFDWVPKYLYFLAAQIDGRNDAPQAE